MRVWGFVHSILVTTPLTDTFFAPSYSTVHEWWADTTTDVSKTRIPAAIKVSGARIGGIIPSTFPRGTRLRGTPIARHLFENGADSAGVLGSATSSQRGYIYGCGGREQWGRAADFLRKIGDYLHILLPHVQLHRGFGVVALHH